MAVIVVTRLRLKDPALRRLEQAGLISGTWSVVGGRRRREYRLTPAGIRALSGRRAAWRDFSATVTAALESATLVNTAPVNAALEDTACPSPNPA